MFSLYRAWRRRRILQRHRIDDDLWRVVTTSFGFVARLSNGDRERLRRLCVLFLFEKQISAAGGLQLNDAMKLGIAIQACVLILNLGPDYYRDWVEIIVYPDEFVPGREYHNDDGLVQRDNLAYSGQAWLRGPLILSWSSVADAGHDDGYNVVMHEFAHKLDMLTGDANGFPPLHRGMSREMWSSTFLAAYEDLCGRVRQGGRTFMDPYACESPAEFFAVASEMFFELPEALAHAYPGVYRQLALFYRQDPLARA